jgi:hypothetical protein
MKETQAVLSHTTLTASKIDEKHVKQRRKKRLIKNKLPPFVPITWDILNSDAYFDLSPTAAKLLPFFTGKNHLPYGHDEYFRMPFPLPYGELHSRTGLADSTIDRVIQSLIKCGFIEIYTQGGLRGVGGVKSLYIMSPKWRDYKAVAKGRKRKTELSL